MRKFLVIAAVALGITALVSLVYFAWDSRDTEYGPNQVTQGEVVYRHHTPYSYRPKIGDMPARTTYASWSTKIRCADIGNVTFRIGGSDAYNRTAVGNVVSVTYRQVFKVTYEDRFDSETQRNKKTEVKREKAGWQLVQFK